ncbi:MAG: NAD-dependent DNA ligase LigA [Lachnospiraceae bacterium]|nr:NAD-dependent DNA ligase LigA [Butyrivibrio sp.]MCM1344476.1 NAD-dependent DNA ligase LigA [Muribaculaceae bacterium]MCM1411865.1 NAD-dependent DNA ligase LigA [Lachnospiraceae bacterium]
MESSKAERMKYLVDILDQASRAYYAEDREIMSNREYDALYDELTALEQETGIVLANSPTVSVGYESVDELPKDRHETPMLSLDKTKSREDLRDWLQGNPAILSWKLDGLTVVLTYNAGKLAKAVTRGNGEIGEVVTNNARTFKNIPLTIPYTGELVVRGEAVITYSDFRKMNEEIEDAEARYKNPRNLCSGSVRQLNNEITAKRNVRYYVYSLISAGDGAPQDTQEKQFAFLQEQGFEVVEHYLVTEEDILDKVALFEGKIENYDVPSDGLVLSYNDIAYGRSLGRTAKFPRHSIAFKWADELQETTLKEIEWSASRTGLINPVAIFEPVELEGTTVSRASVHNISIVKGLRLGIGDRITVYKANMIIPQIAENLTQSDTLEIPDTCPVCGGKTEIRAVNEVQSLYCTNEDCAAKRIKSFTLFVSRDAMNMDGLSEATLEKLIDRGFVKEFADLFHLEQYREEIADMEGFGERSCQNLLDSIEKARNTTLPRVVYGLGIANIGVANAKMLCRYFDHDLEQMRNADVETLSAIDGVGGVIASAFVEYMQDEENRARMDRLMAELKVEVPQVEEGSQTLAGLNFVITGSLEHFVGRNDLKEIIERKGGKVTGSVTGKTTCLINNDITSSSSKNKKAKELGVPILSEEDFLEKYEIPRNQAD